MKMDIIVTINAYNTQMARTTPTNPKATHPPNPSVLENPNLFVSSQSNQKKNPAIIRRITDTMLRMIMGMLISKKWCGERDSNPQGDTSARF